jgi:hypothetical protein
MGGKASRDKGQIDGLSRYEIYEDGKVVTTCDSRTRKAGHVVKGSINNQGYKIYKLVNDEGIKIRITCHRLVVFAFLGIPPSGNHQVAHNDGNRLNNHYTNLRWATPYENTQDKYNHGTILSGSRNPRAILNETQIKEIRSDYKGKYGDIQRLANKYGLSHSAMYSVCHGINWREC